MTKSEKQSWEQERAKGREHFFLSSIRRAGLPFGVLMTLGNLLFAFYRHESIPSVWRLLVMFGFYTLGFGSLMGLSTWSRNELDYQKPTEDDDVV
ncbi:MAG TPA: hypothetical protein VN887_20790 [Candidatus Angelobacter sp.]|nr:hypothetical protein [Candidatus Angelobacter sp.]